MTPDRLQDGIQAMVPREEMCEAARRLRDTYAITPGLPLIQREFGYYCLDEWQEQGMPQDVPLAELFGYEPSGEHHLGGVGWCQAAFAPAFEEKVLEDRGDHEVVQDTAGRGVLFFKDRRSGFMPAYLSHPVTDLRSWREKCLWRLGPATPSRYEDLDESMAEARAAAGEGKVLIQYVVGAYMYLRSLIGPERVLYAFYDMPDLIEECMETWLTLADAVIARHQQYVTLDQIAFGEDICYNAGSLISPAMIRRFLLPYYQQLVDNVRARRLDPDRHLYVYVDTDGYAPAVIDLYREMGMDYMSPFEVASGCDVVEVGRQYPDLIISGGIDKRVLAQSKEAIDAHLEYVLPPMRARGGYIPTCDHGVPAEVSYENYVYFRKRAIELGTG